MTFDYTNYRETDNLVPIKLDDKEQYYSDLTNIEHSFTGRVDVMFLNQFLAETVQLVINAIVLFEKGYFDAAFYSLRQSLEISTTSMYFADDTEENRKQELRKWRNQDWFPMNNQMLKTLHQRNDVFSDVKKNMSEYFEEIEEIKGRMNKYVHKQGWDKFYISRKNNFSQTTKDKEISLKKMISDFEESLVKTMGAIAISRLVIDPMPLLLMDESIYNRTGQMMSEAYREGFIEKYIGTENIEDYKKTELYKSHYDYFMTEEEMLPAVVDVVKSQYVDRFKISEITSQNHLLSQHDRIAVTLFLFSEKIVKIYCLGGFLWYFTNADSKRTRTSWSSEDLKISNDKMNIPYDEVFLSHIKIEKEDYYIEHNEELSEEEKETFLQLISAISIELSS